MNDVTTVFLEELDRIIARAEKGLGGTKAGARRSPAQRTNGVHRLHLLRNQIATERSPGSARNQQLSKVFSPIQSVNGE